MRKYVFTLVQQIDFKMLSFYMKKCKELSKNLVKDNGRCHMVLGNESCDLDSAVSAVALAYYLTQKEKVKSNKHIFPVLHTDRKDYSLKTEIVYLFNDLNIPKEDLIFKDDLNLANFKSLRNLDITLVDHNKLTGQFADLEDKVVEVIDHHVRSRPENDSIPVNIEMVGSCSTLVAEKLVSDSSFQMPPEVGVMLNAAILLDTVCLSEQAGRKTLKDQKMVEQLEKHLPKKYADRKWFFETLMEKKSDISELQNVDLLRKDLKVIHSKTISIAVSSVPSTLELIEQRRGGNLYSDLCSFTETQGVKAVLIMAMHVTDSGQSQRQIAVFSPQTSLRQQIMEVLCKSSSPDLGLTPLGSSNTKDFAAFNQSNVSASRKKVLPLLQDFINSLG